MARGTAADPITLRGYGEQPGSWGGVRLTGADANGQFEHCRFQFPTTGVSVLDGATATIRQCLIRDGNSRAIYTRNSTPTIEECELRSNGGSGIRVDGAAFLPTIRNNEIRNNTDAIIHIAEGRLNPADLARISGTTWANNGQEAVSWTNVTLDQDYTWGLVDGMEVQLHSTFTVPVGVELTVPAGQQVRLANRATLAVRGELQAVGTAADPISFTTNQTNASQGDWWGVVLDGPTTSGSRLEWCDFSFGRAYAFNRDTGLLSIRNASPTITQCTFRNSQRAGLFVWGTPGTDAQGNPISTAAPQITLSRMRLNREGLVLVDALPILDRNSFVGNTRFGVQNPTTLLVDATNSWWGDPSGPTHTTNPGGTGDSVSDNVLFNPWLPAAPLVPAGGQLVASLNCPNSLRQGSTVTIPFVLDPSAIQQRFGAFRATLSWDPGLLQFVEALDGDFAVISTDETAVGQGQLEMAAVNANGAGQAIIVARVKFTVIGQPGQQGNIAISFTELLATAGFQFADLLPLLAPTPCPFTIIGGGILGDVDGDGVVSIADALLVASYVVGLPLPAGADINQGDVDADGQITLLDVLMIATYVVDPNNGNLPPGIGQKPALLALGQLEEGTRVSVQVVPEERTRGYRLDLSWNPEELAFVGLSKEPVAFTRERGRLILADLDLEGLAPLELEFRALAASSPSLQQQLYAVAADLSDARVEVGFRVVPQAFALRPNFPNPFNPTTAIRYDLPHGTRTSLKVYNVQGQVIRTLVSRQQMAGSYQVTWDGLDDHGRAVATGHYFYRLEAGGISLVRRMMLLK